MRGDDASANDVLIDVADLDVRVGGRTLLEGVSLQMRPGEIITLVGPNGGGKTTLVRAIVGELRPSGGQVRRRAGLRIGYTPQRLHIDRTFPLTAARFLALAEGRRPAKACVAALERVDAGALASKQMSALSGGEFQRVLLARALLRAPDLLVLDEPTQALDQSGGVAFYRLIERLRAEHGVAVLLVSHELHVVMAASDRVICLNGHVCCAGPPADVSAHPAYRRLFGDAETGVLSIYRHEHDHAH